MENYFLSTFSLSSEFHLICSLNYRVLPCPLDFRPSGLFSLFSPVSVPCFTHQGCCLCHLSKGQGTSQCCAGIFHGTELISQLESCLKCSCCYRVVTGPSSLPNLGPCALQMSVFPRSHPICPSSVTSLGLGEKPSARGGDQREYKVHFLLRIFK